MTTLAIEPSAGIKRQSRTAADPATDCDLLRARMGGWTEFFVSMFPAHPAQHERRPVETAEAHE